MKIKILLFLSFISALLATACIPDTDADPLNASAGNTGAEKKTPDHQRLKKYAGEALAYCSRNKMDTDICLLADMSVHSGRQRFVVWDFKQDTIKAIGLVSHGCGNNPWGQDHSRDNPEFSNEPDSHCSSTGKYKIGARGYSQWGIHVKYLMHGLEATNKNALKREIVLHGWDAIQDKEVYPGGTPEGWGCPAVSNNFMTTLDRILKDRKKPVLLWIYQ